MSKKINPILFRLAVTKNWNVELKNNKLISPKDVILRKFIFLLLNLNKIKLVSYKLINNRKIYLLYINSLPIKQKLIIKKNKHYWFKIIFYNLLKLNKLKLYLEKQIFKLLRISLCIFFKSNVKTLFLKNIKKRKNFWKKKPFKSKAILAYFFRYSLAFSSTLFLGFFIQQMVRKYKKQRKMLWKVVILTIKNSFKSNKNLVGIRLKVKGKLNGRKRAKTLIWSLGSIPIQSTKSLIRYSINYCYNIYGSFGIKIWINIF